MTRFCYACADGSHPLGYVWAYNIKEARLMAKYKWPTIMLISVERYDGVL
jgi:hypothetical protein